MPITYRRGVPGADDRSVHAIFEAAVNDIDLRVGSVDAHPRGDIEAIEADWRRRRTLFEHLAATADEWWIAEDDGRVVGYARSILRDGLRELTEFFVHPERQAGGIGRELLARAFPTDRVEVRAIIATLEPPALARYFRVGMAAYDLIALIRAAPSAEAVLPGAAAALRVEAMHASPEALDRLAAIDRAVLGHRRDPDHAWFLAERHGLLFRRDGRPVGYGYVGVRSGPFAALDPADLPAMVALAERIAAERGVEELGIWVPLTNGALTQALLGRGFRLDPFLCVILGEQPPTGFDRYVVTDPPFFF
jgi:GNAT superfamily N-acetyltransferase